jgi:hypothetical protein
MLDTVELAQRLLLAVYSGKGRAQRQSGDQSLTGQRAIFFEHKISLGGY